MQGQIRQLNINLQPISSSVSKSFTTAKVTYTPFWDSANQENYDCFKHYKVVLVPHGPIPHLGRPIPAKIDNLLTIHTFFGQITQCLTNLFFFFSFGQC